MDRELNVWEDCIYLIGRNAFLHARVDGTVDGASVKSALKKLQARHPMARVAWKLDAGGTPRVVDAPALEIPLVMEARSRENSWVDAARRSLNVTFRENEILVSVMVLTGDMDFDINITADHAISDGLSLLFVLRDILEFISDPGKAMHAFAELPSLDEMFPPAVAGMVQAMVANPPRLLDPGNAGDAIDAGNAIDASGASGASEKGINSIRNGAKNTTVYPWTIGGDLLDAFLQRCKAEGITFHAGFSIAVLTARARESWCKNPPFMIPVNIRRMLARDVGERLGYYLSNVL
nr:hypothetical protein [Candidatus Sigynarchaeota archaeon]